MCEFVAFQAPAKINLSLHVTGQRADGYHLLDSIVVFTGAGDEITVTKASERQRGDHRLTLSGPFADGLETGPDNLVLKAVRLFGDALPALDLHLIKRLPVASGIGGGSSDAAATLKAVAKLLNLPLPDAKAILALGADVPVCMSAKGVRMRGIGEEISPLPALPELYMVLANPGVGVSTPAIFKRLTEKNNPSLTPFAQSDFADASALTQWLHENRNDLEKAAIAICPEIQTCLDAIARHADVLLWRMSGSGATCFGLFASFAKAQQAADRLKQDHPNWWVVATNVLGV